ncbi:MAG: 3-deoxy-D-manno-octulosonic acid transferase [Terrimicrobiaceae bacterium]|nr:3-deoxy-D-manno-octulosonic acid transferase [Terrimicrobiaceae bacterium]
MTALLWLYNLLFPVVLLIMLPGMAVRMARRGNYRHKFGQRFGIYSGRVRAKLGQGGWVWIHAVSVGEMMIALRLAAALRQRMPEARCVLSTTTSTGYRLAHRHRCAWIEPVYHPLDFPWTMRRAFQAIRPRALVMVEAEVWPNAVHLARRLGIPRVLVNARLSPRSERRYRLARPLPGILFNALDRILLQEPGDVPRWRGLGVAEEKLEVTGSIKFDLEGASARPPRDFRPALEALGVEKNDPILLGGSTFEGEEELLARVAGELPQRLPRLLLILVPRHAERARAVHARLRSQGHDVRLRSEASPAARPQILIVNTTGELADWYRCATVVFVGKSLASSASGGQNPIEPIVAGKPVIFGPRMDNFQPLSRQLVEAGGAVEAASHRELLEAALRFFDSPDLRESCVQAALACLSQHRGATRRSVEILAGLLGTAPAP